MTTKLIALPKQTEQAEHQQDEYLAVFSEYPPRGDMNNPIFLHEPSHMRSIAIHFGNYESTFVLSEVPISPYATIRRENRKPDLIVTFDCDRDLLIRQKGYSILAQGKPPDFVLEVASESTGVVDYTDKRRDYANCGIPEYWRFDPSGGFFHEAALAGDRLVEGKYEPIEIQVVGDRTYRGYSEVLGLWVYWDERQLRWFDPKSEQFLRTHDEEYQRAELEAYERQRAELRAIDAETRAESAETRAESAEIIADYAEQRAAQEMLARQQAQTRADQAEHRAAQEAQARQQAQTRAQQAEQRADQAEQRADQEAQARQQAQTRAQQAEQRATQEAQARQQAEAESQRLRAQLDAARRATQSDDEVK